MDLRMIYVSIGNSDDRLDQKHWARFAHLVMSTVQRAAREVHGVWWSAPDSPYQNACVGFELHASDVLGLQSELTVLRQTYGQNAVAWAEVEATVMI
jgi:hypothetical protein